MYVSVDDDEKVYTFALAESTAAPNITAVGGADGDVTGLAVYVAEKSDYLFVAQEDKVAVYNQSFSLQATLTLIGLEDIEIQGLAIYQASTDDYPHGVLTYAIESDPSTGFGITSLDMLKRVGIKPNTNYTPRLPSTQHNPICASCTNNGFCTDNTCECFTGYTGPKCTKHTCVASCSNRGTCVGPNECTCRSGWGGPHCSFLLVEPTYETDARPGDGDDPAIWISPVKREDSRVVATIKSGDAAGLGVFDLKGRLVQEFAAGEPNNVDVIYGFDVGGRTVDLAFAACRADDTLW